MSSRTPLSLRAGSRTMTISNQRMPGRGRFFCGLSVFLAALSVSSPAIAQGTTVQKPIPTDVKQANHAEATADQPERERAVTVGIVLLGIVLIVSVALTAFVMLGGAQIRRNVRRRVKPTATPDPLWYLKSKKDTVTPGGDAPPAETPDDEPESS